MRKITLFVLMALSVSLSHAQSIVLSNSNSPLTETDTNQMDGTVWVQNSTSSAMDVMCMRTVNNLYPGHGSHFCWNVCYTDESTFISTAPVNIPSGATSYYFHGYIVPHGYNFGHSTVCYRFYDANNIADSVSTCFEYDNAVGIQTLDASAVNPLSEPSPNPANNLTGIKYSAGSNGARIVVYNLLGKEVKEIKLTEKQGAIIITTSDLGQGVYYYSLFANGKMLATKKLVIAHK